MYFFIEPLSFSAIDSEDLEFQPGLSGIAVIRSARYIAPWALSFLLNRGC
jgi:hypothetical protein